VNSPGLQSPHISYETLLQNALGFHDDTCSIAPSVYQELRTQCVLTSS